MVPLVDIHEVIADHYGMDMDLIFEDTRRMQVVEPRSVFYYMVRELNPMMSYSTIGSYGIVRSHSTIIHAHKTIKNLMDVDKVLKRRVELIRAACLERGQFTRNGEKYTFHRRKFQLISELNKTNSVSEMEEVFRKNFN